MPIHQYGDSIYILCEAPSNRKVETHAKKIRGIESVDELHLEISIFDTPSALHKVDEDANFEGLNQPHHHQKQQRIVPSFDRRAFWIDNLVVRILILDE